MLREAGERLKSRDGVTIVTVVTVVTAGRTMNTEKAPAVSPFTGEDLRLPA